jgi:hypothetical protein
LDLRGSADEAFAVAVSELPWPDRGLWAGLGEVGAAAVAELERRFGGEWRRVAAVHLARGERWATSVRLSGPCATLVAVPSGDEPSDLRLRAGRGPADEGHDPEAVIHVCTSEPLEVQVRAARGTGPVWLLERRP